MYLHICYDAKYFYITNKYIGIIYKNNRLRQSTQNIYNKKYI